MSDAFRCDGCDSFFGGVPAATVNVAPNCATIGTPLNIGHRAGVNDAHPREDIARTVEWPYHRTKAVFCADCTADHIAPGVRDAAAGGRYDDE